MTEEELKRQAEDDAKAARAAEAMAKANARAEKEQRERDRLAEEAAGTHHGDDDGIDTAGTFKAMGQMVSDSSPLQYCSDESKPSF